MAAMRAQADGLADQAPISSMDIGYLILDIQHTLATKYPISNSQYLLTASPPTFFPPLPESLT